MSTYLAFLEIEIMLNARKVLSTRNCTGIFEHMAGDVSHTGICCRWTVLELMQCQ